MVMAVESIPWGKWVELQATSPEQKLAKNLLETTVRHFHGYLMLDPLPIALVRKGGMGPNAD